MKLITICIVPLVIIVTELAHSIDARLKEATKPVEADTKTVSELARPAAKEILKIGDDKRVPMRQVYDLYKGELKPADVFAATKKGEPTPEQLSQRLFYAHLYVGIYHELLGDKKAAFEHLNKAAEEHR